MNCGFVKLYRDILDSPIYLNKNAKELYIHLLLKSNWEDKKWGEIDVKEGELITSIRNLVEELKMPKIQVETAIKNLIKYDLIEKETTKTYTKFIIKNRTENRTEDKTEDRTHLGHIQGTTNSDLIINLETTQNNNVQNLGHDLGHDLGTTKEVKEVKEKDINNKKEKINKKENPIFSSNEEKLFLDFFETYNQYAKKYGYVPVKVFTEQRKKIIKNIIKKGYSLNDIKLILEFYKNDEFMIKNKYTTFEGLTRITKIEERLDKAKTANIKTEEELPENMIRISSQSVRTKEEIEIFKKFYENRKLKLEKRRQEQELIN